MGGSLKLGHPIVVSKLGDGRVCQRLDKHVHLLLVITLDEWQEYVGAFYRS